MARPSTQPIHPRELVLQTLRKSKAPMTAYTVLEALAPHGIKGPPIVYRALDALMDEGKVHKIQAISAYIACNCAASHKHSLSVLTICGTCHTVNELHDHSVMHQLEALRSHGIPLRDHAVIELPITCKTCAA